MVKFKIPEFISRDKMINVVAICVSTLLLSKTINVTLGERFDKIKKPVISNIKPPTESFKKINSKFSYKPIEDRNIFDSANLASALKKQEQVSKHVGEGPVVKSSLDAELIGTIVISDPRYSVATIRYKSETGNYYVGDKIEEATVTSIARRYVEILRGEQREFIEIPDEGVQPGGTSSDRTEPQVVSETSTLESGIVKKGEDKFEIARERLEAALSDMNSILKQARAIPYMVGSKTEGFKIVAIRPKSIYQELGIRNGDIIQRVNGKELDSVESVLTIFQSLKTEANFTIDIKRRGDSKTYMYNVK